MGHGERLNKCVMGISKGREREGENKKEVTVKEIMVNNFLKLMKDIKIFYQIKAG